MPVGPPLNHLQVIHPQTGVHPVAEAEVTIPRPLIKLTLKIREIAVANISAKPDTEMGAALAAPAQLRMWQMALKKPTYLMLVPALGAVLVLPVHRHLIPHLRVPQEVLHQLWVS